MNAYYLRCRDDDVPVLLVLGEMLGVLMPGEDGVHVVAPGCVWDVIGPVCDEAGPVVDETGTPYWHANLFTPFVLRERAQEVAAARPEIAEALATIPRWFLSDADGNAVAPASPVRVLFGQ
jgi:hypothetical protein